MRRGPLMYLSFTVTAVCLYLDYGVVHVHLNGLECITACGRVGEEQVQTADHEMISAGNGRAWRVAEDSWL